MSGEPMQPLQGTIEEGFPEIDGEGFLEIDGEGFYLIPDVDRLQPFLMSIVSGGRPVDVHLEPRGPHRGTARCRLGAVPVRDR